MLLRQTAAILLAAGRSLRHPGQHKLCRDLDGRPLGLHAAARIAALAPSVRIAVCSEPTRDLVAGLSALGFEIAWNDDPGRGLATSIAAGVRAARRHPVEAVLICLADMPFVGLRHMRALVDRLDPAEGATAAGSRGAGSARIGPPAAFAGATIDRLLALDGDRGAAALLIQAAAVDAPPEELADFDSPADFEAYAASR